MKDKILHSQPTISSRDIRAVTEVLRSQQLSQGKKADEFENAMRTFLKAKYAAAVNSGTSALHLALLALGIKQGDAVIVPSFVCSALLNVTLYAQAKPIIVDVNEENFNIDANDIRRKMTAKTKAIIVPHMFGYPADLKSLKKFGLPLIEDCAQAIGSKYFGKNIGTLGEISVFSFYATKMLTTGEGGMIISSNKSLLNKIKDLREYDKKSDFQVRYNYKMSDFQAALGISQLAQFPQWIQRRRAIAMKYNKAFSELDIQIPVEKKGYQHSYYRYVIKVPKRSSSLIAKLKKCGIECASPINKPLHRYLGLKGCKVSDRLKEQAISIPLYPSLTNDQAHFIIRSFRKSISEC